MIRTLLLLVVAAGIISTAPAYANAQAPQKAAARSTASRTALTGPININTASAAELEVLPGVGAKTAERIVEYRQKNGPFKKIEELMNVRGIGEKAFLKLKSSIIVTSAKPEHANGQQ